MCSRSVQGRRLKKRLSRGGTDIERQGKKVPQKSEAKVKVNDEIRYPEVRLIGPEGEQLGLVSSGQALEKALAFDLDLVEVAAGAKPPVCRIMNYDKFRYELKKKQQDAKKKQTVIETKEIKFRPKTEEHDLNFKIKNIKQFLEKKNKVKLTMRFRGREIVYAESIGMEAMRHIAAELSEVASIQQEPTMEGKQLVMFVVPKN